MSVSEEVRQRVRRRADDTCEYCRLPEMASILPHQVDHVIGVQHGGQNDLENLCLSCIRCNLKKGPNIASVDLETSATDIVALFHPRLHRWHDHFRLEPTAQIQGLTPQGRATTRLLEFNVSERLQLRRTLMEQGWRP
jgi:hypothetical protein